MELFTTAMLVVWSFAWGYWVRSQRPSRPQPGDVLGKIFVQAVKETRDVELFAGMGSVSQAIIRDGLGKDWVITIERAGQ